MSLDKFITDMLNINAEDLECYIASYLPNNYSNPQTTNQTPYPILPQDSFLNPAFFFYLQPQCL